MAHILPRRAPYICKSCQSAQISSHLLRPFSSSSGRYASLRQQLQERSPDITSAARTTSKQKSSSKSDEPYQPAEKFARQSQSLKSSVASAYSIANPRQVLKEIQEDVLSILESEEIPKEQVVKEVLSRAQKLASVLIEVPQSEPVLPTEEQKVPRESTANPSLFSDLNEPSSNPSRRMSKRPPTLSESDRETFATRLAKTLYTLLEDPKIFITEPSLTTYTSIITSLSLPQYLPAIFRLYAHKPIPVPGSKPIKYRNPFSRAPKYAIPLKVTDEAINSAIARRDLPLTITLIDLTVNTPQYFAAKFLRKAALPLVGASSVIPLSYSLSNSAAMYQLSWDPDTFFWMCMAGSTAYLGTMGTLLWITVSTWNDHHKRVRWVPGTPLGRRWFREEERMYFDRVAAAWGYQDINRHGEETGEEWEALREVLGLRYLEVDRSSLLPGML